MKVNSIYMRIPNYINTRNFKCKSYNISLIEDLKNHVFYVLKGKLSDDWLNITSVCRYKTTDIKSFLFNLIRKSNNNSEKIVIKADGEIHKYVNKKLSRLFFENNIIGSLHLELNYRCNLKCKHCFNPKDMNEYKISFEQAKKIIDEAHKIDVFGITLTGGECTINKDFLKIAKYVRKKHMSLSILTNAQKLYDDENLFNELLNIYPSFFKISLYSMDSDIHDNITGVKGSHYKTLNIIKRLREKNISVCIACPQILYNTDSHKYVELYADETGAEFSSGCRFIYNKNNKNLSTKCNYKDIEKFYYYIFENAEIRNFEKTDGKICGAGSSTLSIKPDLDITPCVGFNYILGNYNTTSLKELQTNILPKFREKYIKSNLKQCFKYDYCKYCEYCSLYPTNDNKFLGKSKILCEDAKAYKNAYLKLQKLQNIKD